ncbi:MAG: ABC transporter ATP-binding protein [Anaerolineae bacterium]|nr:ABC transporter ATP-binding protein [Anaerolineae bacterium]
MDIIRTEGLTKEFLSNGKRGPARRGQSRVNLAVDRLDLAVRQGEVFGFLGPNGAGKTTTVRMLCALIAPSRGKAWVAGHEVGPGNDAIRGQVGILTETPGLYERLDASTNLSFFAKLYGVGDVPGQVEKYLKMLGLWERRTEMVGGFSKGMRQKLAIARALLHEPPLLFLDEPTSGLDPDAAKIVREFIEELRSEGRTIFMCTHNLDEADRLCDRIGVIRQRLVRVDTPGRLRQSLYGSSVLVRLRTVGPEHLAALRALSFVQEVREAENTLSIRLDDPETYNPQVVRALVQAGADVQFVEAVEHSLEAVYFDLMAQTDQEVQG